MASYSSMSRFGMYLAALSLISAPAAALKDMKGGRLLNPLVASAAPGCGQRPDFVTESRPEIAGGFEALPKGNIFVARDAEMWVEGVENNQPVKLHSYQSFLKASEKSVGKIICGNTPSRFSERFSLIAPTLVDVDSKKKVGHSLWQFQVIAEQQAYTAWNKRSPTLSKTGKLDTLFKEQKTSYRLFQTGHNEYELQVQKETGGIVQTLSVRYEAIR